MVKIKTVAIKDLGDLSGPMGELDDPHDLLPLDEAKHRMLVSNPAAFPDDPARFLAILEDPKFSPRVVGRLDVVPARFAFENSGDPDRIWFGSEFSVPAVERGTMAGIMLLAHFRQVCGVCAASDPSRVAFDLYDRLGWTDFPLKRYVIPIRLSKMVGQIAGQSKLGHVFRLASIAASPFHRIALGVARSVAKDRAVVQEFTRMTAELKADLESRKAVSGPVRSAEWTGWLLSHQRQEHEGEGATVLVARDRDAEILSFALITFRRYQPTDNHAAAGLFVATIKDWWSPGKRRTFSAIIADCLDLARQRGVDCLLVSRPERDDCRIPAYIPAIRKGVQHMVFQIDEETRTTKAFEDLRPGDGEAFWT